MRASVCACVYADVRACERVCVRVRRRAPVLWSEMYDAVTGFSVSQK